MQFRSARFAGSRQSTALTLDAVRAIAPSAFAPAPHDSRSARYTYIPTSEVIAGLMREGFQPFKATQGNSRIEGKREFTKHMIRFRHASALDVQVGDSVPEVVLINSHDGTSAYKLMAGIFRLVCSNGLVVAESTVGSLSVPHKGNIVDQVIQGSFQVIQDSRRAIEVTEDWNRLQLTSGEQAIFAEAAHTLRFADAEGKTTTPIQPAQLLAPRRAADTDPSLWHTFNRVQENAIRGGLSARLPRQAGQYRGRRVTTPEIKGIDQDVKLNRALWTLAEKMAELKAA